VQEQLYFKYAVLISIFIASYEPVVGEYLEGVAIPGFAWSLM